MVQLKEFLEAYPFFNAYFSGEINSDILTSDFNRFIEGDSEFRRTWKSLGFELRKYGWPCNATRYGNNTWHERWN